MKDTLDWRLTENGPKSNPVQSTAFYCMGPQLRVLFLFLKGFKIKKVKNEEKKEDERRI